jgi:polyhydroxyalkanoate synthesis regulator phasin
MQQEAWRTYLQLALGVSEASRRKATAAARDLVGRGGATAEQVQALAEDLVRTGLANREALLTLVRYELERALGRVGLATTDQVAELAARVRDLERQLLEVRGREAATGARRQAGAPAGADGTAVPVARKAVKKVAKKAVKAPGATLSGPVDAATPGTATPARKAAKKTASPQARAARAARQARAHAAEPTGEGEA